MAAVPTWTLTPVPSPTPIPAIPTAVPAADTLVPTPLAITFRVRAQSNVRAGPGTNYGIVGSQQEGDTVRPIARTSDGQWLELGPGWWIFASLVEGDLSSLPINRNVTVVQIADSAPTSTPTPVAEQIQPLPSPTLRVDLILPAVLEVRVRVESEVWAGPDTGYEPVGSQQEGDTVRPVARTKNGRWLELESGHWILAANVEGETDDLPITTAVPSPNSPPTFVKYVDGKSVEISELTNFENTSGYSVGAKDENSEDTEFSFAITGGDDGALFTLYRVANSNSVIVTHIDIPNFEAPHDRNKDNAYQVQITVTSGTGERALSTSTDFTYHVVDREELPSPPTFLEEQTTTTATTVTVYWKHGPNTGALLTDYVLRYMGERDSEYVTGPDLDGDDTAATIEGLDSGIEYLIELKAFSKDGETEFRDARTEATTAGNYAPGPEQPSYDGDARDQLFDAIREDNGEVVADLINERGFPIFLYEIRYNFITAMHFAGGRRAPNALEALLNHPDADPDLRCDIGEEPWESNSTPLHRAVKYDIYETIIMLLEYGADPNAQAAEGYTALHVATLFSEPLIVHALLEGGANPNAERHNGRTPLHDTVLETQDEYILLTLLEDPDTDPNITDDDGRTALFHTVDFGNTRLAELLLNHSDTDPNAHTGPAPIHAALVLGQPDKAILTLLLNHADIDPNVQDSSGNTPLHYAVQYTSSSSVVLLLAHPDIDINVENNDGQTPLEYAQFFPGGEAIGELLQQHGEQ